MSVEIEKVDDGGMARLFTDFGMLEIAEGYGSDVVLKMDKRIKELEDNYLALRAFVGTVMTDKFDANVDASGNDMGDWRPEAIAKIKGVQP
jgi:hypothetical protein